MRYQNVINEKVPQIPLWFGNKGRGGASLMRSAVDETHTHKKTQINNNARWTLAIWFPMLSETVHILPWNYQPHPSTWIKQSLPLPIPLSWRYQRIFQIAVVTSGLLLNLLPRSRVKREDPKNEVEIRREPFEIEDHAWILTCDVLSQPSLQCTTTEVRHLSTASAILTAPARITWNWNTRKPPN